MCYYKDEDTAPIGPLDATQCARKVSDWDPAATAEAQALAQVGSLQHEDYGERTLQSAVDLAYDASANGLTDAQLQQLMHTGGTP